MTLKPEAFYFTINSIKNTPLSPNGFAEVGQGDS